MKKRSIALLLAVAAILGLTIGGTLAWLTASSEKVENTFTTSDIGVTLVETKNDFKMVPGYTIEKDPKVTVTSGSEFCWLFVEIEESTNLDTYISYTVAEGWTKGDGTNIPANVWYREIDAAEEINVAYSVLSGDKVTVNGSVTKAQMEALKEENAVQPTLSFKAYASQLMKDATTEFTAAQAWANVKPANS